MSLSCIAVSNTCNHYQMIRTGIDMRNTIPYSLTYCERGGMDKLGDRLYSVMQQRGWSEGELSRRSGIKQPTIHRIITGESKDPRQGNVERLAFALGIDAAWLRSGKGGSERQSSNVAFVQNKDDVYRYPVVSWVAAGAWSEAIALYEPGGEYLYETSDYCSKGQAFWLEVKGDSMTSPAGISIPQGMMILVDPEADAINGSLVVARISNGQEATFKKLVIDGGTNYLKALNPAYPVIVCDEGCEIVGVVVEAKLKLRTTTN